MQACQISAAVSEVIRLGLRLQVKQLRIVWQNNVLVVYVFGDTLIVGLMLGPRNADLHQWKPSSTVQELDNIFLDMINGMWTTYTVD